MKKVFLLLILLFISTYCFAEDTDYQFTDGCRNGFALKNTGGYDKAFDKYNQYGYVEGVSDALKRTGKITIPSPTTIVGLYLMINEWYKENPKEGYKPIVDVVIELYGKK